MDLEIVFNELSIEEYALDSSIAKRWMSEFIDTILAIKVLNSTKRNLRTRSDFNSLQLAPDYTLAQWRNDPNVDRESQSFLRSLQNRSDSPLPEDIIDENIEVKYQIQKPIGLCYAFVYDLLAISLQSSPEWDYSLIDIEVIEMNDSGDLETTPNIIKHVSCKNHIREHQEWLDNQVKIKVIDGLNIWQQKKKLFPSLDFCDNVHEGLKNIGKGEKILMQIRSKLSKLEKCCKNWTEAEFKLDDLASKASPESESRLQRLEQKLSFICPDGEKRKFSLHVRMTPGAWRLYFFPLRPGKIVIGYIGLKIQ